MSLPSRRRLLEALAIGATTISGCSSLTGMSSEESPSSGTPESGTLTSTPKETPLPTPVKNPRASPAPTCREGYYSLSPWWVVVGPGPVGGFRLSLDQHSFAHGDTLTATLTNVTSTPRLTGNKSKFDIQYRSENGWHTILGNEYEQPDFLDDGVRHEPEEGFTWKLPLTQQGLSNAGDEYNRFQVCTSLAAGDYRFVYWGVSFQQRAKSDDEEYAVGVRFTLSED
ncbi:hypothetical protein [Haloglomus litoreum]|uniref:hypothetical protein n=1 Tax=Haloglomus litoreum TaxID=3034026 RepID=UPI0023E8E26C|nr:hypothetical protein [Haloglomus sp. DT116]